MAGLLGGLLADAAPPGAPGAGFEQPPEMTGRSLIE
jgi:hypothetical protein